jgi:hypothetical protein
MNVGIDSSDVEMTTRKPFENSIPAREVGNVGMVYQTTPELIDKCSITKSPDRLNAFENRLDSDLLEPVNTNELMIKINPIKSGCRL